MSSPAEADDPDAPTPRWVKVSGLVALALVAVFVGLHLLGYNLGGH